MTLKKIKEGLNEVKKKLGRVPTKREYDALRDKKFSCESRIRKMGFKWSEILSETFPNHKNPDNNRMSYDVKKDDSKLKGSRRYFVTSAIAGATLDKSFANSIHNYCRNNDAKLVILPMRGVSTITDEYDMGIMDLNSHFVTEYTFNSNLKALDLKLLPQQINPLTGLNRMGQKAQSIIIASPKQQMVSVATGNSKYPHLIHSTGAITRPSYNYDKAGIIAEQDHILGGLIVEVVGDLFFIRQVQANNDGSFFDLNKHYFGSKVLANNAEAVVLGDIHSGSEDPSAMEAWNEVIQLTKPKHIILHDVFDGLSINHHIRHKIDQRAALPEYAKTLEQELNLLTEFLKKMEKKYPKSKKVIVKSNHDEFLDRYLSEAAYHEDPQNYRIALDLAIYKYEFKNAIKTYVENKVSLKNTLWLEADEDFKINGVQLGSHGHLGLNGARGSSKGFEVAYGNSISGHTHSPNILRDTWTVGTSTHLKLAYNRGPSSWLQASCILHKNKKKQMIISIKGKWHV